MIARSSSDRNRSSSRGCPRRCGLTELASRLVRGAAPVLLEGPPPAPVLQQMGIRASPAEHEGKIVTEDRELRDSALTYTGMVDGWVAGATSREVPRDESQSWTRLRRVPLDAAQAAAWRAPGWDVERWEATDDLDVAATWRTRGDGDRWPAIVSKGSLTVCCFSLFAYLGQCHSAEPVEGQEHRSWPRVLGLEALVLALVDRLHGAAGQHRVRMLPWPHDAGWVLNVRHDVDRSLQPKDARTLLRRHASVGTSATFYWRAAHLARPSASRRLGRTLRHSTNAASKPRPAETSLRVIAADARHEIALHTERLWNGAQAERTAVERVARRPIVGSTAHGDPRCFRWQGAPNVLWAERQGLLYTELIQQAHLHPHRFAALEPDGVVRPLAVICLPHHESFDRSMQPGDTWAERLAGGHEMWRSAGGLMQVLNHPDIHLDELFDFLGQIPADDRLDWTAMDSADWWRRTHVSGEMTIRATSERHIELTSTRPVYGAVLETLGPDGSRRRFEADLEPDVPAKIDLGPGVVVRRSDGPRAGEAHDSLRPRVSWDDGLRPAFAEAVREHLDASGAQTTEAAVETTVKTNSDLVSRRAEVLVSLAGELADIAALRDLRVLEVGCGFGALASYLASVERPLRLVAVDNRSEFVEIARRTTSSAQLDNLEYAVGDMRGLEDFAESSFDLVLANNAFIYLPDQQAMESALVAFQRVLAPGGSLILYHANRWQWREPFTRDPIVHLLPARLAERVSRRTGWRHNHGRVRLVSPRALRRMLRRSGYRKVRVGAYQHGTVVQGPRARVGRFYAIGGRTSKADTS